jgi:tRNA threonylcarbamoyladenosine biosynthesis protein TsaB
MRILAIETSGRYGSLALLGTDGERLSVLAETTLTPAHGRTAQALAPALQDALAEVDWPAKSIRLVAVAVGPGSFTGLRIGVTTAKTFAYAVGAEILSVNTLAVMAAQAPWTPAPLWTTLDAQRQQLFVARFLPVESAVGALEMVDDTAIMSQDEWFAGLHAGDRVTGPPLKKLAPRLPPEVIFTPPTCWEPSAAFVGRIAWRAFQSGRRDDLWRLAPIYYRPSAAEEKAARRNQSI